MKTKSPTDKKKKKTREVKYLPATGKSDQMEKQTKKPIGGPARLRARAHACAHGVLVEGDAHRCA